jgi:hypothetical protein
VKKKVMKVEEGSEDEEVVGGVQVEGAGEVVEAVTDWLLPVLRYTGFQLLARQGQYTVYTPAVWPGLPPT